MSAGNGRTAGWGAVRGLLFMRFRELSAVKSQLRSAGSFVATVGLLSLLALDAEGASERFRGLISGVFALTFLPIYCLTKGGETLRGELKDGTIEYIWTRPAGKGWLYAGFGMSAALDTLAVIVPCLLGITVAGFGLGGFDGPGDVAALWAASLAAVLAYTAISSLFAAFSGKFVVLGIFYFSFVEMGLGRIPNGVQRLAVSSHLRQLLDRFSDESGLMLSGSAAGAFTWLAGIFLLAAAIGMGLFRASRYVVGSEKDG